MWVCQSGRGVRPFPGSRAGEPAEKVWRMNDKREHMDTCEYIDSGQPSGNQWTFEFAFILKSEFVDLGLPSGTLWASENACVVTEREEGQERKRHFEYDEAAWIFRKALPHSYEFEELYDLCKWDCDRRKRGYTVTGPNGKSVFFPAEGFMLKGDWFECGPDAWDGYYWSNMATMDGTHAYCLVINDIDYNWQWNEPRKYGMSVRLVKRRRKSKSKKG